MARLCAAGTRKLVRQPPSPLHRSSSTVCKSLSLRDESAFLSPCQRTRATLVCACMRVYVAAAYTLVPGSSFHWLPSVIAWGKGKKTLARVGIM